MAERCCNCGQLADDPREVELARIGSQTVVVWVCRDCFGRYHWAELFVNEWASAPGTPGPDRRAGAEYAAR